MNAQARPAFLAVDHISRTVPDLDAAIAFYTETFGATLMYRIGPIDSADIPKDDQGRDWMETHVGVQGAKLTLAMLAQPDLSSGSGGVTTSRGRRYPTGVLATAGLLALTVTAVLAFGRPGNGLRQAAVAGAGKAHIGGPIFGFGKFQHN